ncbi:bifunctional tetrahydrofolate synthase/dihydrofolate synthase [Paraneptunicella aestuarii]|uniref:bifunctional tetrahydrofolate synthase/dihydrofolate synthase n=1 Tax=Paraneptunicella aestuarii TaxID=2831148 RepID=UPI001E37FDBA|nr:bifunctional tetrahydrofolate synthase/dihydrofolate synthase [Paraneptunicella aestuarii]UAA40377.1 bifunctional tetrahydrofolate synthase/dihydrofolate synthase [Paraneptunicella aestuarii]
MTNQTSGLPADLAGWLAHLDTLHPVEIDLTLERVKQVYERLNLTLSGTVITVAGTNGKGSTCAAVEQIALYLDKKVGVYSSPHLLDYRERVRVDGHMLSEQAHCDAFAKVEAARVGKESKEGQDGQNDEVTLTTFEFGTLAALCLFAEQELDVLILEVGLGGRLDAVNVVEPDLAVLTYIGLDHQDWLGETREEIALEKAGILRQGGKAVIGDTEPPITLIDEVERLGVEAWWQNRDFQMIQNELNCWEWHHGDKHLVGMPQPSIPRMNIGTALAVADMLGWELDNSLAQHVCRNTHLPGRFQIISQQPLTVLDVAHNPQATEYLKYKLMPIVRGNLHLVVGMLSDKDAKSSLQPFIDLGARWYIAPLPTPRSTDPQVLAEQLPGSEKVKLCESVAQAYEMAQKAAFDDDCILVFGSFFTVADVLRNRK